MDYVLDKVVLPLGLSFITFQKIALLVDVRAGRISQVTLRGYIKNGDGQVRLWNFAGFRAGCV